MSFFCFCLDFQGHYSWQYDGAKHLNELHALSTRTVMIRRLKKDVLSQLPPKRRERVMLSVPRETQSVIAKIAKRMREERSKQRMSANPASRATGLLLELFKNVGIAKLPCMMMTVVIVVVVFVDVVD